VSFVPFVVKIAALAAAEVHHEGHEDHEGRADANNGCGSSAAAATTWPTMFLSSFVSIVHFVVKNLPRSQQQKFTTKGTKITKAEQMQTMVVVQAQQQPRLGQIGFFFLRVLRALRG
jgi:hypothetical protein